jgi:transcriptional regulator with GAF, ATPase, and Fis domain
MIPSGVDPHRLPAILLAITEQRSLAEVLNSIMQAICSQPGVALARLWLLETGHSCPHCAELDPRPQLALHLRASAGTLPHADRTTGTFHWVPLDDKLKIGHIAKSGQPIHIRRLDQDSSWVRHPHWVSENQLIGFAGLPLLFRGEILGVLAVFQTMEVTEDCLNWIIPLTDAASIAVANARAFEQADQLRRELELERDYLREEVAEVGAFGEILGASPALNHTLRQVEVVANTEANVLILGESGTGKELIARAIHQRSTRSRKPLVKVNCASIPRELFESEFFGHVRGAFTGAVKDRIGRFQLADGGTLFLDEVGEIPLELQSKLLRVLQEGEFERVGEDRTRRVDVRVIAATNRNLKEEVDAGRFRLDLFYRLGVFPLELPPLRDRLEDIPILLTSFAQQAALRFHLPAPKITQREVERAQSYSWPGNIRELQNTIERAVILARGGPLQLDLPQHGKSVAPAKPSQSKVISESEWRSMERNNLLAALTAANGKISGPGSASELLGIHPATLTSRLKAFGIRQ